MDHLEYLNSFSKFKTDGGFRPGLERVKAALEKLGNPEKKLKIIHVAGTNGKGSTSAMMASILKHAGYQVGFYSSPHLQSFNERFRINGVPISDEDLAIMTEKIRPVIDEIEKDPLLGRPSFFEVTTILAFVYFALKKVDVLILEVGLGGRLDATNVALPLVSVITSIGYDHTEYLGNTLARIAYEKAGIIKKGVPVVTGVRSSEAFESIAKQAKLMEAPLYTPLQDASWTRVVENLRYQVINLFCNNYVLNNLKISLVGDHQIRNAVVALKTLDIVKGHFPRLNEGVIRKGLEEVKWPGRLELVKEKPSLLLDGAHNIEGIEALCEFLERVRKQYKNLYLVMSILKDKDVEPMVKRLAGLANGIIFTQNHNLRATTAQDLAKILINEKIDVKVITDFELAIQEGIKNAGENDLLCITGSLYTIAEARGILLPDSKGII